MTNPTVSPAPALDAAAPPKVKKQVAQSTFDSLPNSGYLRQSHLIPDIVPFSPATLWRKCKSGDFPKPVKLSLRVTAWRVGDIRQPEWPDHDIDALVNIAFRGKIITNLDHPVVQSLLGRV